MTFEVFRFLLDSGGYPLLGSWLGYLSFSGWFGFLIDTIILIVSPARLIRLGGGGIFMCP